MTVIRLGGISAVIVPLSILAIVAGAAGTAGAHAIAGNRLFPGTSPFDDPGTLDELVIEAATNRHPAADNNTVNDTSLAWSFARLLTPDIAIGADNSLVQRGRTGFETVTVQGVTHLSLKGLLYESDPHEILASAELTWGIGGSGSRVVDAGPRPGFGYTGHSYAVSQWSEPLEFIHE